MIPLNLEISARQETAEDSKARFSQIDLENRQYQCQGHSYYRRRNRTCFW